MQILLNAGNVTDSQLGRFLALREMEFTCMDKDALLSGNHLSDSGLLWQSPIHSTLIAQEINDPNVVGQMQHNFEHFVQTGQIWALLIGLVIGWMLRNLTSYG